MPKPLDRLPLLAAALLTRALGSNRKSAATHQAYGRAGLADAQTTLNRLVSANLRFTAAYYARCWGLACRPIRRQLRRTVHPIGDDHLRRALEHDCGAILVAIHLGDFDLGGHWVASEVGCGLVVASTPVQPACRGELYELMRSRAGFRVRRQDQTTLRELAHDLRKG